VPAAVDDSTFGVYVQRILDPELRDVTCLHASAVTGSLSPASVASSVPQAASTRWASSPQLVARTAPSGAMRAEPPGVRNGLSDGPCA
jgi:hypothetical protein